MPTRERLSLPGGDFALLTDGPAAGPLAVCLHGFPDHPPSFAPLLAALGAAGYRAVAPWLRGYAPSTLEGPFSPERRADDLRELIDALSPERPVYIIGHDWGATVTYDAVSRWPERFAAAVTLAVPHPSAFFDDAPLRPDQLRRSWYIFFFQIPHLAERVVARDDFALIDRLWRGWSPGHRHPEVEMRALKRCLAESMPAPIEYYRALLRPLGASLARVRAAAAPARRIRVPLLCLMGAEDGCIGATIGRSDRRYFTGPYQRQTLPGVGHFLPVEAPEEVARRAIAWFGGAPREEGGPDA